MPSIREIAGEVIAKWKRDLTKVVKWERMQADIEQAIRNERERCAKIASGVENEWLENARNVARASDIVGGLAQSTYTSYAEVAGKIAKAIREDKSNETEW